MAQHQRPKKVLIKLDCTNNNRKAKRKAKERKKLSSRKVEPAKKWTRKKSLSCRVNWRKQLQRGVIRDCFECWFVQVGLIVLRHGHLGISCLGIIGPRYWFCDGFVGKFRSLDAGRYLNFHRPGNSLFD